MAPDEETMAKADQIKALIRSHAEGDDSRFYAIAMQVAASAARSGHGNLAQELRDLIDKAKTQAGAARVLRPPKPVALAQPRGELSGLLSASYPKTRLVDMALAAPLREKLDRVLHEQRERERLRAHGFTPQRKLLLVGPPGTGKTMTASTLAGEMGVPLFTIQIDGLITKFMGETSAKLRLVFDAIAETRGVFLFDEFDALGSQRGAGNDVGEIRRVLNSFLQFLEQDDSESLIIGATNHVALLDLALFRRFDGVFEYEVPSAGIATSVMQSRLALLDTTEIDWAPIAAASKGLRHAELTRACEQAAKSALLNRETQLDTDNLISALGERLAARRVTVQPPIFSMRTALFRFANHAF